jgi:hypothetical protein
VVSTVISLIQKQMPSFWSSKPKTPAINTQSLAPTSNPNNNNIVNEDQPSARAFSTTTQGTRSSEEEVIPSGQTTPKPSGLDNRIPAIASVHSASFRNIPNLLDITVTDFYTSSNSFSWK